MDMDALKKQYQGNPDLRAAANSAEARRLLRSMDAVGVERAAKRGDAEALTRYLAQALSTPEGRALAEKVQGAVRRNG